jgi:hypothetical protein
MGGGGRYGVIAMLCRFGYRNASSDGESQQDVVEACRKTIQGNCDLTGPKELSV